MTGTQRSAGRGSTALLILAVVGFAAACFGLLAPWQFGKSSAADHHNAALEAAVATPAVPLAELHRPGTGLAETHLWREVEITGSYLPEHEVEIRQRWADGDAAVEVLTPFRVAGDGATVWVDRGYLRPDSAREAIPPPPAGEVTLRGRLAPPETGGAHLAPRVDGERRVAYAVDPPMLDEFTGVSAEGFSVQLIDGQPGGLMPTPLPVADGPPHFSYGLQWTLFGVAAPAGLAYFYYRSRRGTSAQRAGHDRQRRPDIAGLDGDQVVGGQRGEIAGTGQP